MKLCYEHYAEKILENCRRLSEECCLSVDQLLVCPRTKTDPEKLAQYYARCKELKELLKAGLATLPLKGTGSLGLRSWTHLQ